MFGGSLGRVLEVRAGDVVVLPAGVGHCRHEQSPDLLIVGAYPQGMRTGLDTRRGDPSEHEEVLCNIAEVAMPACDPVAGPDGVLPRLWAK